MGRTDGKVVVVTGASGGQGAADALALAAEGATVHDQQMGRPRAVARRQPRARAARDPLQRDPAWVHRDADDSLTARSLPPGQRGGDAARTGGHADEVAPLVVFLISDEASFIIGAEIAVYGGQTAHGGTKSLSDAVLQEAGMQTTEEKRDGDG
jgi:NAD(P)-dependent dehydrogenase (short-subunit alcohol dehydrogenase family)